MRRSRWNFHSAASLFIGVFIGTVVCGDGHSNWFKGVQLATVYIIVATMFYFLPELHQ